MGFGGFGGRKVEDERDVQVLEGETGSFYSRGIPLHLNRGRDPDLYMSFRGT